MSTPRSERKTMKTFVAICLCFLHIVVVAVSKIVVTGRVNGMLTLPCNYTIHLYHHTVCWGRGCSLTGCNNQIIWTDGRKVTWRKTDRYQLLGNISRGDVSLTITGTTEEDEGTYCCRVEIPGLFNDLQKEMEMKIQEGEKFKSVSSTILTNKSVGMNSRKKMGQTSIKSSSLRVTVIVPMVCGTATSTIGG
ncbi:unnamed protein product [Ranitomeya imitator]|uniref:Ig-like domain-containing protein n=1 Tax=Ranitomeya imitator TaxID=111125 RepID=A0ABN9M595_9NEOB|nr:unnamed protein product [Ranitomeya imitator]